MFAFRIEREEHGDDDGESYLDPFVEEGETTSSGSEDFVQDSDSNRTSGLPTQGRSGLLNKAKNFRSKLKHRLLRAIGRKRAQRRAVI